MPLDHYGFLKGHILDSKLGAGSSPHYQVLVQADNVKYRLAINVKSKLSPSELLYLIADPFDHPATEGLAELAEGYHELPRQPGGAAVDYIRSNLFDPDRMIALPYNVPGPDNDLNEKIDQIIRRAAADPDAQVYAFGERWGPENKADRYFGFQPGNGVHDIHMNQGNSGRFAQFDGPWQDGALWIHFPTEQRWVALFLAFQSQCWHTDDQSGHCLGQPPAPTPPDPGPGPNPTPTPTPGAANQPVRIIAARVNPAGHDPGQETVTLINCSDQPVDLAGWALADRNKRRQSLDGVTLAAGQVQTVTLDPAGAQLSNKGGLITLLDAQGLKVHGVSYAKSQASRQGWTVVFGN